MGLNDADLNLGLSLNSLSDRLDDEEHGGINGSNRKRVGRILTARDFTNLVSSMVTRGKERAVQRDESRCEDVDSVQEVTSLLSNQVVGWPPIRAYRMNSLVQQITVPAEEDGENDINFHGYEEMSKTKNMQEKGGKRYSKYMFVKVNMEGIPIGRKVDLNSHSCYGTLAHAVEEMFKRPTSSGPVSGIERNNGMMDEGRRPSKLLDGNPEFALTYKDKEGDWMLVGDVPWEMFLSTVRSLRIMRTFEDNGLGTRLENRVNGQRSKKVYE